MAQSMFSTRAGSGAARKGIRSKGADWLGKGLLPYSGRYIIELEMIGCLANPRLQVGNEHAGYVLQCSINWRLKKLHSSLTRLKVEFKALSNKKRALRVVAIPESRESELVDPVHDGHPWWRT
jgi:hypothetical protein